MNVFFSKSILQEEFLADRTN